MLNQNNLIQTLEIPIKDVAGQFRFVKLESGINNSVFRERNEDSKLPDTKYQILNTSDLPKARYYIDAEDEQDVARLGPRVKPSVPNEDLQAAANLLVESLALDLTAERKSRLSRVILSQLKGIRNPRETREVLTREPSLGGLGLDNDRARLIVEKVEAEKNKILNKIKGAQLAKETLDSNLKDIYEAGETLALARRAELLTEVKPRPDKDAKPSAVEAARVRFQPRSAPKPVGPVEELRLLTLADFRHLGPKPTEATQRIYQKIDLLADESLEQKAQGIKAWQASPVYQKYLAIGRASLEKHRPVAEIIKAGDVSDLKQEEFEAIGDLNKSLQF